MISLHTTDSTGWTPPNLSELPRWSDFKLIGFDLETHDPDLKKTGPGALREGRIAGYSFAMTRDNGEQLAYYVPLRHEGGGNVDLDHGLAYLKDQFASYTGDITGANLPYDLLYAAVADVDFSRVGTFRDVQIAAPILDETQSHYSLQHIAERLGLPGKDETKLIEEAVSRKLDPKADLWRMHSGHVGAYAEQDALLPLQIIQMQEAEIARQGLDRIYQLECDLLPVLLKMTLRGVRIDTAHLDKLETLYKRRRGDGLVRYNKESKVSLDVGDLNKNAALGYAIVKGLGKRPPTKADGKYEIQNDWLVRQKSTALKSLSVARQANKSITSFIKSIRTHAITNPWTGESRIHANFQQLRRDMPGGKGTMGTVSGRLSSSRPNIQQQPSDNEWRKTYVPERGAELLSVDYSGQELRIAVHFAHLNGDPSAAPLYDAYWSSDHVDIYETIASIANVNRKVAKTVVLGKMYGMGDATLAERLGLPTDTVEQAVVEHSHVDQGNRTVKRLVPGPAAAAMINRIKGRFPWMRNLEQLAKGEVEERYLNRRTGELSMRRGYVCSVLGRRSRFPIPFEGTYKALNRIIQSSAADQMKQALVDLDKSGIEVTASIHDEVIVSITDRRQADEIANIMTHAIPLQVPVVVDKAIGPSWGELKELEPARR